MILNFSPSPRVKEKGQKGKIGEKEEGILNKKGEWNRRDTKKVEKP